MDDKEALDMMRRCRDEIATLRAEVARLAAKADAYDSLATVLRMIPKPSVGYGEDLGWLLNKRIREIESASAPTQAEAGAND